MVILWIVSDEMYQGSSRGELEMEPWKGEEQSKQNSSWVLSVPTWNLLEQTKTKRTLGHSLQGTAADKGPRPRSPMSGSLFHTCQTPIRRHIVPHINEHPLPGKGTLTYSNKATSRQTPTREGRWMAKWPAYTKRHMPRSACPPPHQSHPSWVGDTQTGFRLPLSLWMVLLSMQCFTSTSPAWLRTPELLLSSRYSDLLGIMISGGAFTWVGPRVTRALKGEWSRPENRCEGGEPQTHSFTQHNSRVSKNPQVTKIQ